MHFVCWLRVDAALTMVTTRDAPPVVSAEHRLLLESIPTGGLRLKFVQLRLRAWAILALADSDALPRSPFLYLFSKKYFDQR